MQAFEIEAVHNKFTKKFNVELHKHFTKKIACLMNQLTTQLWLVVKDLGHF
jgi:hypothetical protein